MNIHPIIVVEGNIQFRFDQETLKLDGESIECLSLYMASDPDIRMYMEREKFDNEGNINHNQAASLINFIYEGREKPEGFDSEAHIKAIRDAARIYMETCNEQA